MLCVFFSSVFLSSFLFFVILRNCQSKEGSLDKTVPTTLFTHWAMSVQHQPREQYGAVGSQPSLHFRMECHVPACERLCSGREVMSHFSVTQKLSFRLSTRPRKGCSSECLNSETQFSEIYPKFQKWPQKLHSRVDERPKHNKTQFSQTQFVVFIKWALTFRPMKERFDSIINNI